MLTLQDPLFFKKKKKKRLISFFFYEHRLLSLWENILFSEKAKKVELYRHK